MKSVQDTSIRDIAWFPVDNAANLYTAVRTEKWSRTYREAFVLDHEIDKAQLQQALSDTLRRMPSMQVYLRYGLFWSYFERTDEVPPIEDETDYPYRPLPVTKKGRFPFRVLVCQNRIAVEGFHGMTDGGGCLTFLSTLVGRYLELRGVSFEKSPRLLDVRDIPSEPEIEDSYLKHYDPSVPTAKAPNDKDLFLPEPPADDRIVNLIHVLMPVEDIKEAAARYQLSLTEFLTAALILAYIRSAEQPITKKIVISIPIDLRRRFPSVTVRNFAFATSVSFHPQGRRDVPFSEICNAIRGEIRKGSTDSVLLPYLCGNVASQKSPVLKNIPFPLKRAFLKSGYKKNQRSYTTLFSNVAQVQLPESYSRHILRAEIVAGASPYVDFSCGGISVNGLFNFSIACSRLDNNRQREFCRFLASEGIRVRVESNLFE